MHEYHENEDIRDVQDESDEAFLIPLQQVPMNMPTRSTYSNVLENYLQSKMTKPQQQKTPILKFKHTKNDFASTRQSVQSKLKTSYNDSNVSKRNVRASY